MTSNNGKKTEAPADRKQQIAQATLRLVREHGVAGTTTARIAAAVGVTEPALYRHFANRREMLLAALQLVGDLVIDGVWSVEHPDALERLRLIGRRHTDMFLHPQSAFVESLFDFVVAPEKEGLREEVRVMSLRTARALADIVEDGKKQGRIRPDVDSMRAALRVLGFYWFEDVSYLMKMTEVLETGLSTETFEGMLNEIAVDGAGSPGVPAH